MKEEQHKIYAQTLIAMNIIGIIAFGYIVFAA